MDTMMSQAETKRAQVIALLVTGKIDQKEAGKQLCLCVRQIKRIVRRYRAEGLPGLISKPEGGHPINITLLDQKNSKHHRDQ